MVTTDARHDQSYNPDPHAHPGLHAIAIFEAAKGTLALLAASGLEILGPAPLQRWLHELTNRFQLDPQHGAFAWLSQAVNPDSVHLAAGLGLAYAVLRFVEAWGLWRVRTWASWLGCIGAAVYLPFDVYALLKHPGWLSTTVLLVNLIVVWVLARDLSKRHH
ncbi:MAG TPA: DUF2127 domain-containing protein [Lysobacter sp.]|nr:DUF2127 domain-containing protein [Lysobacter sp.]